jgi:hypothetical protein
MKAYLASRKYKKQFHKIQTNRIVIGTGKALSTFYHFARAKVSIKNCDETDPFVGYKHGSTTCQNPKQNTFYSCMTNK